MASASVRPQVSEADLIRLSTEVQILEPAPLTNPLAIKLDNLGIKRAARRIDYCCKVSDIYQCDKDHKWRRISYTCQHPFHPFCARGRAAKYRNKFSPLWELYLQSGSAHLYYVRVEEEVPEADNFIARQFRAQFKLGIKEMSGAANVLFTRKHDSLKVVGKFIGYGSRAATWRDWQSRFPNAKVEVHRIADKEAFDLALQLLVDAELPSAVDDLAAFAFAFQHMHQIWKFGEFHRKTLGSANKLDTIVRGGSVVSKIIPRCPQCNHEAVRVARNVPTEIHLAAVPRRWMETIRRE